MCHYTLNVDFLELVSSQLRVHATVHSDIHHMRHLGHFDDDASAGRDSQGPQHPGEICGAPAGAGVGQATGIGVQGHGVG